MAWFYPTILKFADLGPDIYLTEQVDEANCVVSWAPRQDITASDRRSGLPKAYRWCGCCGSGFQLAGSGRLVVPGAEHCTPSTSLVLHLFEVAQSLGAFRPSPVI